MRTEFSAITRSWTGEQNSLARLPAAQNRAACRTQLVHRLSPALPKQELDMNKPRTYSVSLVAFVESLMSRHVAFALGDLFELASLAAFLTMIAMAARALGA